MLPLLAAAAFAQQEPLDAYLERRIDLVETQVSTVYAPGYDGSGRFWFVVDAHGEPLDAVDLATRLGDDDLARRMRAKRRWAAGGAVGLGAASVGGLVGGLAFGEADGFVAAAPFSALGLVGSSVLLQRFVRLHHPASAYSQAEAEEKVRAYNAALRDELLE